MEEENKNEDIVNGGQIPPISETSAPSDGTDEFGENS